MEKIMLDTKSKVILVISFLAACIIAFDFIWCDTFRNIKGFFIFFIPFVILLLIYFLYIFITKKFSVKINKPALFIFSLIYVFVIQVCIMTYFSIIIRTQPYEADKTPLWTYPIALKRYYKETNYYFPHKIPNEAKNIVYTEYFDSEIGEFTIAFDIDKDYIDAELQRILPKVQRIVRSDTKGNAICKDIIPSKQNCSGWEYVLLRSSNKNIKMTFSSLNQNLSTLKYYILSDDSINKSRGIAINGNRIEYFYLK